MAIEKKSLISTLKTAKRANALKESSNLAGSSVASVKSPRKLLAKKVAGKKTLARLTGTKTKSARFLAKR